MYSRFDVVKKDDRKWEVLHYGLPNQKKGDWVATFKTEEAAKQYISYLQR